MTVLTMKGRNRMATIDEMYDLLATAEKTHTPLVTTLSAKLNAWNTAIKMLGLPGFHARPIQSTQARSTAKTEPNPIIVPITTDKLKTYADDYLTAKTAHDSSLQALNVIKNNIQVAIKAKGV
jgi:hypothetical protein